MRYAISPHPQGTDGWREDRAGKVTSSRAKCCFAQGRTKGSEGVTRRNYLFQLVLERVTGKVLDGEFTNRHTERGRELEPVARMTYEEQTGAIVEEAGFAYLIDPAVMAGCSVDGRTGKGLVEFKCPIAPIHYDYMNRPEPPAEYLDQLNHQLWIMGAEFCDFVSYCPDMPEKLQLHVVRYVPKPDVIKAHEDGVLKFLAEVDELEAQLRKKAA